MLSFGASELVHAAPLDVAAQTVFSNPALLRLSDSAAEIREVLRAAVVERLRAARDVHKSQGSDA